MNLIYRFILLVHTLIQNLIKKAYIEVCKHKGLKLEKGVYIPEMVNFGSEPFLIEVGKDTAIAGGVRFLTHGGTTKMLRRLPGYEDARIFGRIKVGENCMLGMNSIIQQNVEIGNNCILGANSVLSDSMPDNSVFVGNPAKFVCTFEEYAEVVLAKTTQYPRELEANKKELDLWLKENLPYKYKKAKKVKN